MQIPIKLIPTKCLHHRLWRGGGREGAYPPAYDIASMTVYGIIEAVERAGQTTFDLHATPELARIDHSVEALKQTAREARGNVPLTELLDEPENRKQA